MMKKIKDAEFNFIQAQRPKDPHMKKKKFVDKENLQDYMNPKQINEDL